MAADLATGPQLALSLFYLAPIALAAWYLGWHVGLVMCALSTAAWFAADYLTGVDGKMYYGRTFDEHKQNRAKYLDI